MPVARARQFTGDAHLRVTQTSSAVDAATALRALLTPCPPCPRVRTIPHTFRSRESRSDGVETWPGVPLGARQSARRPRRDSLRSTRESSATPPVYDQKLRETVRAHAYRRRREFCERSTMQRQKNRARLGRAWAPRRIASETATAGAAEALRSSNKSCKVRN